VSEWEYGEGSPVMIEVPESVRRLLEPKPRMTVSEWARWRPFEIREKGATNPGPYDLSLTPYMREPLDAFGDPRVRRMNWVICPQGGKTKAAEVAVCYLLYYRPTNMLYIRPTEPDIVEGFKDRWKSVIEHNLPELVPSGEWVVTGSNPRMELTTSIVYGAAVTVARHFTSRSTPVIAYDETDTGGDTGNSLGNALDAADDRQMAASELQAMTVGFSSAKYESGSNWVAYDKRSDRRELWEPCPHCGLYQPLPAEPGAFENRFVVEGGERDPVTILAERLARFVCRGCGALIEDRWQGWMSSRGVWVPKGMRIEERLPLADEEIREYRSLAHLPEFDGEPGSPREGRERLRWEPELLGSAPRNPHRGYRVWAANLNPNGLSAQRSWSHMLARWFDVTKTKDPERLQVFVNSWKSLPWKESLKGLEEEQIKKRVGTHEARVVPGRAKVVFASVDVQETGYLKYQVWAVGPASPGGGGTSPNFWEIEHGQIEVHGEDYQGAIEKLNARLMKGWPIKGEARLRMRPYQYAVDSGYAAGDVYEASRTCGYFPVKGTDNANWAVNPAEVEGKLRPEPITIYHVNRMVVNGRLHRMLMMPPTELDGLWFAEGADDGFISELAAEALMPSKNNKSKMTWQKKTAGRINDHWDTAAYIVAVMEIMSQAGEVDVWTLAASDPRLGVFIPGVGDIDEAEEGQRSADAGGEPASESEASSGSSPAAGDWDVGGGGDWLGPGM